MTKETASTPWETASSSGVSSAATDYDHHVPFYVGTCREMCPEAEQNEREKHHLVHPLEINRTPIGGIFNYRRSSSSTSDGNRMVKEFRRPAAGKEVRCSELRPMPVLIDTVKYLLGDLLQEQIGKPDGFFTMEVYDFIFDRLRAVRQDLTIQRLDGEGAIYIYEQTIAFLVLFGYRLCTHKDFVVKFNETHIGECFGQLISLYDQVAPQLLKKTGGGVGGKSRVGPQSSSHQRRFARNYTLFNSMRALHTLDKPDSLHELLNRVPPRFHSKPPVSTTIAVAKAFHSGNYAKFFRILNHDVQSPLLLAVAMKHCVFMQIRALNVMRASYCGKNLSYPLDHLCQVLRFSSEDEAISLLSSLGVKTVDNRVIFVKSGANSGGGGAGGSHHRNSAAMTEELDQAPKNKQFRFVDQLILRFPHFPLKS